MVTESNTTNVKIEYYRSLDDISIYRFDKCLNGNKKFLVVDYKYGHLDLEDEADDIWEELYNEWSKKTFSVEAMHIYTLACEITHLEAMIQIVPILIKGLFRGLENDVFEAYLFELKEWGFEIDRNKSLEDQLQNIELKLKGRGSKLKRKREDYKDLTKGNKSAKSTSIFNQKIKLERAFGSGTSIDVKKTSVSEWIAYLKELETLNKK